MENQEVFETRKMEFFVPSGHKVVIREQNGADDDILSNPAEAVNLMNLSRFIAGIIISSDYTSSGKITVEQAHELPVLDRYCILFKSRIFSLGNTIEFTYDWGTNGGRVNYEQSLEEFLFDYSNIPNKDELDSKPEAIPFYPLGKQSKDISFTTASGKEMMFDLLTAKGEAWVANLPLEKQTRNVIYLARNLRVKIGEKYEKVLNFSMFSIKDMVDIKNNIVSVDPLFTGNTTIDNPVTGENREINIVGLKNFFYLGEI